MLWCLGDLKMLRNLDILLLVVSNLLIRQVLSSNSDCSVTADQDHVIFTPFVVEYRLSALTGASRLQLIRERGDSQEIVKSVHLNVAQGEEQFACDVITEPGRYKLQVSSDSSTELCWSYVEARWPAIQIRLPRTHESLSGDMAVKLRVPGVACTALETTTRFRLELHYQSRRPVDEIEIVHTANITARRLLQQRSYNLACSLFDLSGFYQVILRAAAPHATVLSGSELVHVTPASYGVTSSLPTLDRCVDTLSLHLKQPHCPAATDKIRVYKKLSTSAMNDPRELQYVTEGSVSAQNLNYVLPCSQFSSQAIGYCFTYVSFSRTGAITEQNKMCINTKKAKRHACSRGMVEVVRLGRVWGELWSWADVTLQDMHRAITRTWRCLLSRRRDRMEELFR